jgi:hypothetical protein
MRPQNRDALHALQSITKATLRLNTYPLQVVHVALTNPHSLDRNSDLLWVHLLAYSHVFQPITANPLQ